MSHTDKYLKYKNKYLELKNQVGGYNIADLNLPYDTDTRTSWFTSILKFLNNYNQPNLTYYELLDKAGVKRTNLNLPDFESINTYGQKIANEYNIIIKYSQHHRTRISQELSPQGRLPSSKDPITVDLFLRNNNGIVIYSLNNGENMNPYLESEIPSNPF
jgi:hypothetical protein